MFDKVERFIRDYDGTKQLVSFGLEKYNAIYDRIRYLIRLKSCSITYVLSHNYAKITIDSDDLPLEETLTLHVIMLIKG